MRIRKKLAEEQGATAVIVAIVLVVLMGAAMVSVDAGNLWQSRRNIITGTDAASLAEANAVGPSGDTECTGVWTEVLADNSGSEAEGISCDVVPLEGGAGYVSVKASKPVQARFGGVFGIGSNDVVSKSAALYGFVNAAEGLRPIGLCTKSQAVSQWLADTEQGSMEATIPWTKQFQDGDCGTVSSNWGWFDFNGGSNSQPELAKWLRNGYYENAVAVDDCNADADPAAPEPCSGDTGSKSSLDSALNYLKTEGGSFGIVLYDEASGPGSNAEFRVAGFLKVRLLDFDVKGPEVDRFLKFEFIEGPIEGACCDFGGTNTGLFATRLCAIDHDAISESERCTT
jgi:hypothetical protein